MTRLRREADLHTNIPTYHQTNIPLKFYAPCGARVICFEIIQEGIFNMMIQDHFEEGSYNHFQDKDITITLKMIVNWLHNDSRSL